MSKCEVFSNWSFWLLCFLSSFIALVAVSKYEYVVVVAAEL